MTQCPSCKLDMESHSAAELIECCMEQVGEEHTKNARDICLNCMHKIIDHSDAQLVECTLAHLKSES